ncbi:response regulator [Paenibacillus silviterrae]|uniref:response regulator n=1 Tax=Paenibacillus silviterrae TaxID=3242194 RepID=UPI002542B19B|nr:response regulator [Paenibacillus chinjuensis]
MKIRCIVVDDEEMILERLEQFFSRHESEFELVGKAYSGAEGAKLAAAAKPDIVLTDIVMPGMNGIEMIEQLRLELPHTDFVILSAYTDFAYAKQAMRMNVQEYVVKVPLSEEELLAALRRTEERLKQQSSQQRELQKLVRHRLENVYRIRRQLMGELLRGDLSPQQLAGLAESMNVDAKVAERYCCLVMEWVDYSMFMRNFLVHDQRTIRYAMLNVAEETIREQCIGFACEYSNERLLAVVSWPNMNSAAELLARSLELGQRLIANMRSYLKQDIHVAVSERYGGWETLRLAFHEASSLCLHGYYAAGSEIFTRQTVLPVKKDAEETMASELDRLFVKLLEERPVAELMTAAERLKGTARQLRLPSIKLRALLTEFIVKAGREAAARHKQLGTLPDIGKPEQDKSGFDAHWQMLADAIRIYLDKPPESGKQEIVRAKHYIETHLPERLTLDDVASFIGLAPTYFSALFKKENGESFVDYVNRRKVEKAAALLKEREYSNNQLCMLVGIQSEKYLCKLFKDMYGIPPQKFRKSIR